jgi:hypothetical protein
MSRNHGKQNFVDLIGGDIDNMDLYEYCFRVLPAGMMCSVAVERLVDIFRPLYKDGWRYQDKIVLPSDGTILIFSRIKK